MTHLVHGWAENEGRMADVLVDPGDQQAWWEEKVRDLVAKLEKMSEKSKNYLLPDAQSLTVENVRVTDLSAEL